MSSKWLRGITFLACVVCLVILNSYVNAKIEDGVNLDDDKPFRMNKVNVVWRKAQKRLTTDELASLYSDLEVQDMLELDVKHKNIPGEANDGELEAMTRAKMMQILRRFNLHDLHEGDAVERKILENESVGKDDVDPSSLDSKLADLLKKASASGFDKSQLNGLKKELWHHQQKMDEFNQLKDFINEDSNTPQEKRRLQDELHRNFQYLNSIVETQDLPFKSQKVIDLWKEALVANFTDVELQSLKAELKHLDVRLDKHEYFQKQADMARDSPENKHKHETFREKAETYKQQVKKIELQLRSKIAQATGHASEL